MTRIFKSQEQIEEEKLQYSILACEQMLRFLKSGNCTVDTFSLSLNRDTAMVPAGFQSEVVRVGPSKIELSITITPQEQLKVTIDDQGEKEWKL